MSSCRQCKSPFEIADEDRKFYEKMDVPEPALCPDCRAQQRFMFRNFYNLYNRKCDLTGKKIISMYDENAQFPVYDMHEWWGDKWDPLDYGKEVDFNRPVFEQLKELHFNVPRMGIMNHNCENTDYCNLSLNSRNCYLVFGNVFNEDCCYGHIVWQSKNCFDCLYTYRSEQCYECIDCVQCYNLAFSQSCENSSDSKFLVDCTGCRNCFGCVGLKNKEFHIFNKPYKKEEYETKIKEFNSGNIQMIEVAKKRLQDLMGNHIVKHYHGINCENVTGDYLYNCKNTFDSYDAKNCENIRYCATTESFSNSYDCNYSPNTSEWSYNNVAITGYQIKNCHNCTGNCGSLDYCDNCYSCRDCFGCVGLKNKQFCIFNKQYSKDEYSELRGKIIDHMKKTGEWGQYFPHDLSPFAYNETMAQEYFPLTKEQVIAQGHRWKLEDKKDYKEQTYKIPDDIVNVPDSITKEVLACECKKNYRIARKELDFYRDHSLPIPRKCFLCRHKDRMALKNPRKLYNRKCDDCQTEIQTTYAPDRPEKVYCKKCYLKTVY